MTRGTLRLTASPRDSYHIVVRHNDTFDKWDLVKFKNTPEGGLYGKWVGHVTTHVPTRPRAVRAAERAMSQGIRSYQGRKSYTHIVVEAEDGSVDDVIRNEDAKARARDMPDDFSINGGVR